MRLERVADMDFYGCGSAIGTTEDLASGKHPLAEAIPSGAQAQCWPGCRTNPQSSNEVNHNSNCPGTADRNVRGVDEDDGDEHHGGGYHDDGSSRSPLVTVGTQSYLPFSNASSTTTANSRSRSRSRKIGSHLHPVTFIALVLLTQLTVNISIGKWQIEIYLVYTILGGSNYWNGSEGRVQQLMLIYRAGYK